jgi:hypothetical protein
MSDTLYKEIPYQLFYHPSIKVIQSNHEGRRKFFTMEFNNSDEFIEHLPDNIFHNLPNKLSYSIENNRFIRNDKVINLLENSLQYNFNISCIFIDTKENNTPLHHEQFKLLSFGEFKKECTCHDPDSPINKYNKSFFTEVFMHYMIDKSTNRPLTQKVFKF